MVFPWTDYENFEDGLGTTYFDGTEVDTGARLKVMHYTEMARIPGLPAPYRGAYCAVIDCDKSAADSYFVAADGNLAADENAFFKFSIFLSNNLTMAAGDEVAIMSLMATATTELTVSLTSDGTNFTMGLTNGPAAITANTELPVSTGEWHTVRLAVNIDAGACNDGDATLTIDGASSTQLGSLDQGAITDIRFGVDTAALTSGTSPTAGFICLDEFYEDETALVDNTDRWADTIHMTGSGHAFVGPGWVKSITLHPQAANADQVVTVYDTDTAQTGDVYNRKIILTQDNQLDKTMTHDEPVYFKRGCYVNIAGTAAATGPFVNLTMHKVKAYGSDAAVRNYGRTR